MANTNSFLFLLSSLKIERKMTQRIGGKLFFLYGLHLLPAEIYLSEKAKTFFRYGLYQKNRLLA